MSSATARIGELAESSVDPFDEIDGEEEDELNESLLRVPDGDDTLQDGQDGTDIKPAASFSALEASVAKKAKKPASQIPGPKKRRKRNMADGDDPANRRKKVSKACIYCKRYVCDCQARKRFAEMIRVLTIILQVTHDMHREPPL